MCEAEFIRKVKEKAVILYGAGMVGKLVFTRLASNGLEGAVIGFGVTHKTKDFYMGVPVYEAGELEAWAETAVVIIATMPALQDEILYSLQGRGFLNIWRVSVSLYQDMAGRYMEEFRERVPFPEKTVDVLFMASDNNSSSGAFLCMMDLNIELKKRGISTAVVLPEYGNGEDLLVKKEISYIYIPSRHWAWKEGSPAVTGQALEAENAWAVREIGEFIVRHHVRLVHSNTTYTYVGAAAALGAGIPSVWHIRENIAEQGFHFFDKAKAMELMNRSAGIIAVSRYAGACYEGLDCTKVHVVYDGVSAEDYYGEKELFQNRCLTVILAGVITPLKGQRDLVEAACLLKAAGLDFRIRLAGSGDKDYIEYLQGLAASCQMERYIDFCGRQDNIWDYYREADIAVVCSAAEAFGRVTVEAQLSGCLVIGADAGATPELIEDGRTGFLYERGNSRDLAEKIIGAVQKPEQSGRIARNGQRYARKAYSRERNADDVMKVYRKVLSDGGGSQDG